MVKGCLKIKVTTEHVITSHHLPIFAFTSTRSKHSLMNIEVSLLILLKPYVADIMKIFKLN